MHRMMWVEIDTRNPYRVEFDFTDARTDERLDYGHLTLPQAEAVIKASDSVDEVFCHGGSHENPEPVAFFIEAVGDYDRAGQRDFFLTPDGTFLCEDCGVEILETEGGE